MGRGHQQGRAHACCAGVQHCVALCAAFMLHVCAHSVYSWQIRLEELDLTSIAFAPSGAMAAAPVDAQLSAPGSASPSSSAVAGGVATLTLACAGGPQKIPSAGWKIHGCDYTMEGWQQPASIYLACSPDGLETSVCWWVGFCDPTAYHGYWTCNEIGALDLHAYVRACMRMCVVYTRMRTCMYTCVLASAKDLSHGRCSKRTPTTSVSGL